jgi:hypothetical protein
MLQLNIQSQYISYNVTSYFVYFWIDGFIWSSRKKPTPLVSEEV